MNSEVLLRHEPRRSDVEVVERILQRWGQFRHSEIAVARELVIDRIEKGQTSEYRFVFAEKGGQTVGFACFGPIAVTVSSFDLYWIAVDSGAGGQGIGSALMAALLELASDGGGTRIFVETSSGAGYAPARSFYLRHGFRHICTVPDFYATGDDKLIFGRSI